MSKMSMNKFLASAATATIVASAFVAPTVGASSFTDVDGYVAETKAELEKAVELNFVKGFEDGTFKPSTNVTRGQVAKVLARHVVGGNSAAVQAYVEQHKLEEKVTAPFTDVSKEIDAELYYAGLVVKNAGIFTGDQGELKPSNSIIRRHMAKVLVEAFTLENNGTDVTITDIKDVQADFQEYIKVLAQHKVTITPNNQFNPNGTVKRIQLASFAVRAFDASVKYEDAAALNEAGTYEGSFIANTEGNTYGPKAGQTIVNGDVRVTTNATLQNLKVNGTIFVDPGEDGDVVLNDVEATKIEILSGGTESIVLNRVRVTDLVMRLDNSLRVVAGPSTVVENTSVLSGAILHGLGGTFGEVTLTPASDKPITLRGDLSQSVVTVPKDAQVGGVTIESNAQVGELVVTGNAQVGNLVVEEQAKVGKLDVQENSTVGDLNVDKQANVESFDNKGTVENTSGSELDQIGKPTPPPAVGGGGGGGSVKPTPPEVEEPVDEEIARLQLKKGTTINDLAFKVSRVNGEGNSKEAVLTLGQLATAFSDIATDEDLKELIKLQHGENLSEEEITEKVNAYRKVTIKTDDISVDENGVLSIPSKYTEIFSEEDFAVVKTTDTDYKISVYYADNAGNYQTRLARIAINKADGVSFKDVNAEAIGIPAEVDKTALEDLIVEAKNTDTKGKTGISVKALGDAIKAAEDVVADEETTQDQVSDALTALTDAINGLKEPETIEDVELQLAEGTAINDLVFKVAHINDTDGKAVKFTKETLENAFGNASEEDLGKIADIQIKGGATNLTRDERLAALRGIKIKTDGIKVENNKLIVPSVYTEIFTEEHFDVIKTTDTDYYISVFHKDNAEHYTGRIARIAINKTDGVSFKVENQ